MLISQQLLHVQLEYEKQVSQLTMSIAAQEEAVRRGEEEKHSILQDLSAVRDLCTKLEATKDSLQRQLTARTLDQEKVYWHVTRNLLTMACIQIYFVCNVFEITYL